MSDKGPPAKDTDVLDHVRQALKHAEEAVRCYLALIAGKAARLGSSIARVIVVVLGLTVVGLVGLIFVGYGFARWLENSFGLTPGAGLVVVGVLMMCAVIVGGLLLRKKDEGDS